MTDEPRRWLSFDPTIHAGHIMTAIFTIIGCAGIYFGIVNDVSNLKQADAAQTKRIDGLEQKEEANRQETDRKINDLIKDNNQAIVKLRDDMNSWFMALNDKLDRKADKR